ncbi:MAG: hydroxymethylbilane synthase [Firmicutes bacterium]|nr:hydroxymethylbilane synthase [Bacillota bacterium]
MSGSGRGVPLRLGTRGSTLARAQAGLVAEALRRLHPGLAVDLVVIKTEGDRSSEGPLDDLVASAGGGVFVKEIQEQLLQGNIDLAVHSAKDLPTEVPRGLRIAAYLERGDPRDALVSTGNMGLARLPRGARAGTTSPRRRIQLARLRPDLSFIPIRGNVDTRLRKLREGVCETLVLAAAGLDRIGMGGADTVTERLSPRVCLPAAGQGALAVEARDDDRRVAELCRALDHHPTRLAVEAERSFLAEMGGGCRAPIGVLAYLAGSAGDRSEEREAEEIGKVGQAVMIIEAFTAEEDGSGYARNRVEGPAVRAAELAAGLALSLGRGCGLETGR